MASEPTSLILSNKLASPLFATTRAFLELLLFFYFVTNSLARNEQVEFEFTGILADDIGWQYAISLRYNVEFNDFCPSETSRFNFFFP